MRKRKADHFDSSQGRIVPLTRSSCLSSNHISPCLWTLCLCLLGKGARGHKISDYFEVSGRKLFLCCTEWESNRLPCFIKMLQYFSSLSCLLSNLLFATFIFIKLLSSFFSLFLSVSLREVAVLVPALPGEFHQLSALPHNTPSPTPLSRWACLLYGLSRALFFFFLNLLSLCPVILTFTLVINTKRSNFFTGRRNLVSSSAKMQRKDKPRKAKMMENVLQKIITDANGPWCMHILQSNDCRVEMNPLVMPFGLWFSFWDWGL